MKNKVGMIVFGINSISGKKDCCQFILQSDRIGSEERYEEAMRVAKAVYSLEPKFAFDQYDPARSILPDDLEWESVPTYAIKEKFVRVD
jgi:hypothetical protein